MAKANWHGNIHRTRYACKAASLRLGRGSLRKLCTVAVAALETSSDLDLEGKAVVVAGLGVSGRAAAELALDRGATVTVVDDNAQVTDPLAPCQLVHDQEPAIFLACGSKCLCVCGGGGGGGGWGGGGGGAGVLHG